jgi:hypothetical protein
MSWTTPRTWTSSIVTVPQMQEISDDLTILKTAINNNGLPIKRNYVGVVTSTYTVTSTDQLVVVFVTCTVTLPPSAGMTSRPVEIKSIGATVTMALASGDLFDYLTPTANPITLYPYDSLTFTADGGTNWWIS